MRPRATECGRPAYSYVLFQMLELLWIVFRVHRVCKILCYHVGKISMPWTNNVVTTKIFPLVIFSSAYKFMSIFNWEYIWPGKKQSWNLESKNSFSYLFLSWLHSERQWCLCVAFGFVLLWFAAGMAQCLERAWKVIICTAFYRYREKTHVETQKKMQKN